MLPLGLWLSARSAEQLAESIGGGAELRDRLAAVGLSIVTLNGFPYQDFHGSEVKLRVYEPHWANTRRAQKPISLLLMPKEGILETPLHNMQKLFLKFYLLMPLR